MSGARSNIVPLTQETAKDFLPAKLRKKGSNIDLKALADKARTAIDGSEESLKAAGNIADGGWLTRLWHSGDFARSVVESIGYIRDISQVNLALSAVCNDLAAANLTHAQKIDANHQATNEQLQDVQRSMGELLQHLRTQRDSALLQPIAQRLGQVDAADKEALQGWLHSFSETIDQQYQDKAGREKALGRDAKALQNLLAQLRAAAAKAAREAARAKAAAEREAKATGKPAPKRPVVASAPAMKVGGLGWPVSGSLLASFGGRLPDGRRSDGVLIAAAAGTAVKAVADGTVVFADWMTGYGNILIIDHGNGYMSLYAHNDGLLRDAGDAVKRGDAVASVGTSGGQDQPALYFELRRDGAPVNPSTWLTRQ